MTRRVLSIVSLLTALCGFSSEAAFAASYYFDSQYGNDSAAGTELSPWRTLDAVPGGVKSGDVLNFKAGGAWDPFVPVSGTAGAPTVYRAYGGTPKPKFRDMALEAKSYVRLEGLEITNDDWQFPLRIINSHHISVTNCTVRGLENNTTRAAFFVTGSHDNVFEGNTVEHLNRGHFNDAFLLEDDCDYNIIKGNTIGAANHYSFTIRGASDTCFTCESKGNYVGYNTVINPFGPAGQVYGNANNNVIEHNTFTVTGLLNNVYPTPFKLVGDNNVFRKNILTGPPQGTTNGRGLRMEIYRHVEAGMGEFPPYQALNNRVYGNVITGVGGTEGNSGAIYVGDAGSIPAEHPAVNANNIFVNNVVFQSTVPYEIYHGSSGRIHDNRFINNLVHRSSTDVTVFSSYAPRTIAWVQANESTAWTGNLATAPNLDSSYKPLLGSAAINGGAHLTKVTSPSGSGTSVVVEDPIFFSKGMTIAGLGVTGLGTITGDMIQIGTQVARITQVSGNTLSLDRSISWTQNAGVSLPYAGTAPDIGVTEVASITASAGSNGSISPAGTTLVKYGASQSYTVTPNTGYRVASVTVNGTVVATNVASYTHAFSNVTANQTISATFSAIGTSYTITASAGTGGTISPAGASVVTSGGSKTYTIAPTLGYYVVSVTVDGTVVATNVGSYTYTFNNVTANHTISAVFGVSTFDITASATSGGTITPSGVTTVNYGTSKTYTIAPIAGYYVASVTVDGTVVATNVGSYTYTFSNVAANHTISAVFGVSTFDITASATVGGTITPAGVTTVNYGTSKTYSIAPIAGYYVVNVKVDGVVVVTNVGSYTYTFSNVSANHTISATFGVSTYDITASATVGGTITPSGVTTVNYGTNKTYTIAPIAGYYVVNVKVDGVVVVTNVGSYTYTFSNVTANHTISATFGVSTYDITASASAGGSITPAGVTTVNYGTNKTYTIAPYAGYYVASVSVDGTVVVTNVGSYTYTFTNVRANHTISAVFGVATASRRVELEGVKKEAGALNLR